jgi:hypothetical protein
MPMAKAAATNGWPILRNVQYSGNSIHVALLYSSIMSPLRLDTRLAQIFGILDAVRHIILDCGLNGETLLKEAGTTQHSLVSTL